MSGKGYANDIKLSRAYGDGRRAAQQGALIGTNPHVGGTPQSLAWIEGFNGTFTNANG